MKKTGLAIAVFLIFSGQLFSQSLGHDNTGNSPLIFPSGHVDAEIPAMLVSASYHHISNSRYKLTNGVWGLSLSGRERAGIGSLFTYGPTATEVSAAFTAGVSISNEYQERYKSPDEYRIMLDNEEAASQRHISSLLNDTAWINNYLSLILATYPAYGDTLRNIYFETGPDSKTLFQKWKEFARTVPDSANGEDFRIKVENISVKMRWDPIFADYRNEEEILNSVQKQKQSINEPPKPFSRFILYTKLGIRSLAYNTVQFSKIPFNDSTASLSNKVIGFTTFSIGLNHHINNNIFIGYSFGVNVLDNFESLTPLTIDTSRAFSGNRGRVSQSQRVYSGELKRIDAPFFSLQFSFITRAGKDVKMLVTPLYVTLAPKNIYGASLQIISRSKFTFGVNIQQTVGNDEIKINQLSYGFRLGYLLADFDFGN